MWMPSHPGEHRGGQFGGELEQGGGASSASVDAELAESFGHAKGADGLAGLPAGEQPEGSSRVADGGVPVPGRGDLPGQNVEGVGKHNGLEAETQPYLAIAGVDVPPRFGWPPLCVAGCSRHW
ncbi:hypothetical protein GCM10010177_82460 [Actinomadura citrea]|nr:hypothetical protein GCM10010177_82460 [Actinomadura citrea]